MLIGSLKIEFRLHGIFSIKEKRSIVLSLKQKIRNKFNVSVAEVEAQDNTDFLVLAVITVANETRHIQSTLNKTVTLVENNSSEEITDISMEVFGA